MKWLYWLGFWTDHFIDYNGPKPYVRRSRFAWWKGRFLRRQSYRKYVLN